MPVLAVEGPFGLEKDGVDIGGGHDWKGLSVGRIDVLVFLRQSGSLKNVDQSESPFSKVVVNDDHFR